ncbi:MAG: tetratricopeptide repeat protein [Anaerolineales bacterium]
MTSLKIHLFGDPYVERDRESITFSRRKVIALLAYLAVNHGQPHSRDALAVLLWPESDRSSARANLRRDLFRLKKSLGEEALHIERERVSLDLQGDTKVDVVDFQQWLEVVQRHDHRQDSLCTECLQALTQAAAVYRNDFMAGFGLPDSAEFDDWQFFQNESLQRSLAQALQKLITWHAGRMEFEQAIEYARRWLSMDSLHEPAQRTLMQLYADSGQQAAALRQYEQLKSLLESELGLPPEESTASLFETIRSNRAPSEPAHDVSSSRFTLDSTADSPVLPDFEKLFLERQQGTPFVGRQEEMERLNAFLETALTGEGQVAFVTGAAGQGKTALIQAFARKSHQEVRELIVAVGNCNAYTGLGDPYLPFREILALLSGDIESGALAGKLHAGHARRLWEIAPITVQTLLENTPDLVGTLFPAQRLLNQVAAFSAASGWEQLRELADQRLKTNGSPGVQQAALFEQYSRLIQILTVQAPLLLVLEDLHWADLGSISLLFHLGRRLSGQRILILGTYRPDELAAVRGAERHPLERVINEFQRDFGDIFIDLDQAEGEDFVTALLDSQPNLLSAEFRRTLYHQTQGHALFTVELLQGMQERGDLVRDEQGRWIEQPNLDWETLPARVEGAIGERVKRLDASLRDLLQVASVEGEEFTAEVLAQVLGTDLQQVVQRLSRELDKTHRLVQALATQRTGTQRLSRYRFRHNLIQRYMYGLLDSVERVYLHESVGEAMETLFAEQLHGAAVQLARHFGEAQIPEKALVYLQRAGDQARHSAALEEAGRYYQAALEILPPEDHAQRASILRKLGECYWVTGDPKTAQEMLEDSFNLFEKLGDIHGAGAVQRMIGRLYWEMGDRDQALAHYQQALSILEQGPESAELAWAISSISQMYMLAGDYQAAITWGDRALEQALRLGAHDVAIHALNNVGTAYLNTGDVDVARPMLEESARRARALGLPHDACRALVNLGEGLTGLGHYQEAHQVLENLHDYAAKVQAPLYAGSSLVELAKIEWWWGDWKTALRRRQGILKWLQLGRQLAYLELVSHTFFAHIHNDLGQFLAAGQILIKIRPKVEKFNELQMSAPFLREFIRTSHALGRHSETQQAIQELMQDIDRVEFGGRLALMSLLSACYVLMTGDISDASRLAERCLHKLEETHIQLGSPVSAAALAEARGLILSATGQFEQAAENFQQAVNGWRDLKRPYDRVRALLGLGQAFSGASKPQQARNALDQALKQVGSLTSQLEDPGMKQSFVESPLVVEIRSGLDAIQPASS